MFAETVIIANKTASLTSWRFPSWLLLLMLPLQLFEPPFGALQRSLGEFEFVQAAARVMIGPTHAIAAAPQASRRIAPQGTGTRIVHGESLDLPQDVFMAV